MRIAARGVTSFHPIPVRRPIQVQLNRIHKSGPYAAQDSLMILLNAGRLEWFVLRIVI